MSIFIFSLACLKPGYRINQSSVVHKGLSWFIFEKKRQFLTFFWFPQISYCLPSWLYTSAKYEICKSCVHYTMRICVCLWTWLVFFRGFAPESGCLIPCKYTKSLCLLSRYKFPTRYLTRHQQVNLVQNVLCISTCIICFYKVFLFHFFNTLLACWINQSRIIHKRIWRLIFKKSFNLWPFSDFRRNIILLRTVIILFGHVWSLQIVYSLYDGLGVLFIKYNLQIFH